MEINYDVSCPECGEFEFQVPENAGDDTFLKCDNCGFDILVTDLREHGMENAKDVVIAEVQKQIKSMLGKFKL